MTTQTKLPIRTAESILQEIDNGSFKNWSLAEKALNVDSLEVSKAICAKQCSDGDLQNCVRLELSSYHQRIHRALLIIKNQRAILPYEYTEVRYPIKEEPLALITDDERPNYPLIFWAIIGFLGLAVYLYQM